PSCRPPVDSSPLLRRVQRSTYTRPPHPLPTRRSSDLLLLGVRLLLKTNTMNTHIGLGMLAAWIIALGFTVFYSTSTFTDFQQGADRKSTRLNSSHVKSSYAVFCLKKKNE